MSATSEPPDEDGAAYPQRPRGRRLKARRASPPLRLIEQGSGGVPRGATTLDLTTDGPITLMRVGGSDLAPAACAIEAGARPTAIVTGLTEGPGVTSRARRASDSHGAPWLSDPLLFRTGLPGYRTAQNLQALDYTPGRDGDPYQPSEFSDDADLCRRVGRSVIGAQVDQAAAGAIGGAFVIDAIDDPWLPVNQTLLRIGADAAATWGLPLIAPLPVRLSGFEDLESQRLLVRAFAARRPDAWLLLADGLSADSGVERVVTAMRLALLLQATGTPVILGRAGELRRLALALGVSGAEFGLGRFLRFSVPDFGQRSRGPGPTPGPRMEVPSLASSMTFEAADRLLRAEAIAEADCGCPACAAAGSIPERLAAIAQHNAHAVVGEAADLAAQAPAERVAALDRALEIAGPLATWLEAAHSGTGLRARVERQRRALDACVQAGLLEPARLAAELRLFD